MMKIVLVAAFLVVAVSADVGDVLGGAAKTLGAGVDTVSQTAQSLVGGNVAVTVKADVCTPWVGLKNFYISLGILPIPGTFYCSCPTGIYVPIVAAV